MSNALQAIPTEHGLDILTTHLRETVTTYALIGALTHDAQERYTFHSSSIETSYFDDNGVLTYILDLPIDTHFDEYLHHIHILDADGEILIDCATPKVALAKGIGGMVTLKVPITGEAGEVVFKASEFVTETELNELFLSQYSVSSVSQFLPYNPDRIYQCGEVCYTVTDGKVSYWEWYSNVESLAGKDPLDNTTRQAGWEDETKPFYWTPFKRSRSGSTQWPWMSMTFPEGSLNVLGNSVPTAVFWRLAEALPEFVNAETEMIDFPETGGEFFRVLDLGRGIDFGRALATWQKGTAVIVNDSYQEHVLAIEANNANDLAGTRSSAGLDRGLYSDYSNIRGAYVQGNSSTVSDFMNTPSWGGGVSRPRNLAFPILVEI